MLLHCPDMLVFVNLNLSPQVLICIFQSPNILLHVVHVVFILHMTLHEQVCQILHFAHNIACQLMYELVTIPALPQHILLFFSNAPLRTFFLLLHNCIVLLHYVAHLFFNCLPQLVGQLLQLLFGCSVRLFNDFRKLFVVLLLVLSLHSAFFLLLLDVFYYSLLSLQGILPIFAFHSSSVLAVIPAVIGYFL